MAGRALTILKQDTISQDAQLSRVVEFLGNKVDDLSKDRKTSFWRTIKDIKAQYTSVPVSIFSQEQTVLEATIAYLKDQRKQTTTSIARSLKRDPREIHATYTRAKTKTPTHTTKDTTRIPLQILEKRILSPLEAVVWHLKNTQHLTHAQISHILGKDQRTIWTAWNRARIKDSQEPEISACLEDPSITEIVRQIEEVSADIGSCFNELMDQIIIHRKSVPASIFSQEQTVLEATIAYLKDQRKQTTTSIARSLKRDPREIHATYTRAKTKTPTHTTKDTTRIPLQILEKRILSPLEAVVWHLKNTQHLTHAQISHILGKDQRTIWTAWNRARGKAT